MMCATPDMGDFNPYNLQTHAYTFSASFQLDGYSAYQNLSIPMTLTVNPNVYQFTDYDMIHWYNPTEGVLIISVSVCIAHYSIHYCYFVDVALR